QVEADFDYYRYGEDPRVDGTKFKDPSQWQVSVGLKWNFFESGQSFYKVKQAQSNIFRLESEYQNLKNTLSFEVKAAYLKVQSQKQSIIVAKKGLAEAEEGFRLAQARYEAKVGTNTDVLDAQARLSKAEANYIQAMADYLIALANLNKAMGKEEFSF
ncbi:MAG TPA: TolC family protein, partial [Desulfonauticus sp.]|nr:TolC family protein [Desulfonauticus sp.]